MIPTLSSASSSAPPDSAGRRPLLQRPITEETKGIAFICLLDLLTTLYWVSQGQAREGNPVLAFFLDQGIVPFIVAKLVMFVPSLIAAEWYRPRNPRLITRLLRWVIAGYLFLYVAGIGAHTGRVLEFYHRLLMG
jgi:hypothetical protein